jgi:hypothetical protein
MLIDIRDKPHISHEDIIRLNFIRDRGPYVFRKYHKQGLRSQIIEVLHRQDVVKQTSGEHINGILFFPWANPIKILRIFRSRFNSKEEVFEEIKKLKIVETYLPPGSYAKSIEFIVDYVRNGTSHLVLCGLQDYIEGEALNPWEIFKKNNLADIFNRMKVERPHLLELTLEQFIKRVKTNAKIFIQSTKKMILEAKYVPDFAGVENLLLTPCGHIKLVDINNISKVSFGSSIRLDEKGYPVCDKSIEAISMLEQALFERLFDKTEKIYRIFLDPQRMKEVNDLEEKFHFSTGFGGHYPKESLT